MIFATVGTQLPFPRLIDALDGLAPDLPEPIIAQCGPHPGTWSNLDPRPHLTPGEYETLFSQARLVVAHAGIGTILSAKRLGKPLVILPRRHALGEHRNDHQLATAREVSAQTGVYIAWDTEDLLGLLTRTDLVAATQTPSPSADALIDRLSQFIESP